MSEPAKHFCKYVRVLGCVSIIDFCIVFVSFHYCCMNNETDMYTYIYIYIFTLRMKYVPSILCYMIHEYKRHTALWFKFFFLISANPGKCGHHKSVWTISGIYGQKYCCIRLSKKVQNIPLEHRSMPIWLMAAFSLPLNFRQSNVLHDSHYWTRCLFKSHLHKPLKYRGHNSF